MKLFIKILLIISLSSKPIYSNLTDLIHKRYYYIARLEKTINTLIKINQQDDSICVEIKDNINFLNNITIKYSDDIKETKKINSLFKFWEDIIIYKYIDEPNLMEDFVKLLYIILKKIVSPEKTDLLKNIQDKVNSDNLLEFIDEYTEYLESPKNKNLDFFNKILNIFHRKKTGYPCEKITTENVTFRFYLIHRLKEAYFILNNYKNEKVIFLYECVKNNTTNLILDNHLKLRNKEAINCLNDMIIQKNIYPLIKMYEKFLQYHFIDDKNYINDFLKLFFATQKNFLNTIVNKKANSEIDNYYIKINEFSIEDLLYSIDLANKKIIDTKKIKIDKSELLVNDKQPYPITNIFQINIKLKQKSKGYL